MRKTLAVLLIVLSFVFLLASCGNNENESSSAVSVLSEDNDETLNIDDLFEDKTEESAVEITTDVQPATHEPTTVESTTQFETEAPDTQATTEKKTEPVPTKERVYPTKESGNNTKTYVLNTNTHKFHYPSGSSVYRMKDKNKEYYSGSRESLIAQGYSPCGKCHP